MERFVVTLPEAVSQGFQKLKVSTADSQRAANTFIEASNETVNTITTTIEKAKDSLAATAAEKVDKAVDQVTKTAEKAKDFLNEVTGRAVDTVTVETSKAVNTITETAKQAEEPLAEKIDQTKTSLEGTLERAEQLSNTASNAIQKGVSDFINQQLEMAKTWVDSHAVVSWVLEGILWGINHPIFGLIAILLAGSILWKLIKVIGRLIEKVLLSILQAFLKLSQFLLKFSLKPLGKFKIGGLTSMQPEPSTSTSKASSTVATSQTKQEQLARALARLEAINQEQNQLLKEVTVTLLASDQQSSCN